MTTIESVGARKLTKKERSKVRDIAKEMAGQLESEIGYPPLSEEGKFTLGGRRAEFLALPIAGFPDRLAWEMAKNPDKKECIKRGMRSLLNRQVDTNIDPLDVINGLGEKASEMIQELREGVVSSFLMDKAMETSEDQKEGVKKRIEIEDVLQFILLLNDFTSQSRDTRSRIFSLGYTMLHDELTDPDKNKHAKRNRYLLPDPAVVKLAVTRQIEREENIGLAFVHHVLEMNPGKDKGFSQFRQLIAQSLVEEMDSRPSGMRVLIQRAADAGDMLIRSAEDKITSLVDISEHTRRHKFEDELREQLANRYIHASRKAYVEGVLALVPQFEDTDDKESKVKWQKAKESGAMLLNAYTKAQEILHPTSVMSES